MAWQDAGLGAWVYDGAVNRIDQDGATRKRVYDLTITSTSTLVVRGEGASGTVGRDGTLSVLSSPPAGGRALRTFAIPAWDNVAVYGYEDGTGVHAQQHPDYAGHGPSGRFIVYFETRAPDLVRATNTDDGISADPDPFEVQPGEWRVFCGGSDDGLPRAVLASSGTDADVFADVGPERLDTPNRLWGVHAETHLDEDTLHVHRWTVNLPPALVRPPTNLRP